MGDLCWNAGLRSGDAIFSINGGKVGSPKEAVAKMEACEGTLVVEYWAISQQKLDDKERTA